MLKMGFSRNLKYLVTSLRRNLKTKGSVYLTVFMSKEEMYSVLVAQHHLFKRNQHKSAIWYKMDARPSFELTLHYTHGVNAQAADEWVKHECEERWGGN